MKVNFVQLTTQRHVTNCTYIFSFLFLFFSTLFFQQPVLHSLLFRFTHPSYIKSGTYSIFITVQHCILDLTFYHVINYLTLVSTSILMSFDSSVEIYASSRSRCVLRDFVVLILDLWNFLCRLILSSITDLTCILGRFEFGLNYWLKFGVVFLLWRLMWYLCS